MRYLCVRVAVGLVLLPWYLALLGCFWGGYREYSYYARTTVDYIAAFGTLPPDVRSK